MEKVIPAFDSDRTPQVLEFRQFYTDWWYEANKNRFLCFYFFKPDLDVETYKRQILVFYPDKSPEYTYFFNVDKQKYWGRCCTKHNAKFSEKEMKWNFPTPAGSWGPLTPGSPPIPLSLDKKGMISPPDPPQSQIMTTPAIGVHTGLDLKLFSPADPKFDLPFPDKFRTARKRPTPPPPTIPGGVPVPAP